MNNRTNANYTAALQDADAIYEAELAAAALRVPGNLADAQFLREQVVAVYREFMMWFASVDHSRQLQSQRDKLNQIILDLHNQGYGNKVLLLKVIRELTRNNFKRQHLLRNFILKNIDVGFLYLWQVFNFIVADTNHHSAPVYFNWMNKKLHLKIEQLILFPEKVTKNRDINLRCQGKNVVGDVRWMMNRGLAYILETIATNNLNETTSFKYLKKFILYNLRHASYGDVNGRYFDYFRIPEEEYKLNSKDFISLVSTFRELIIHAKWANDRLMQNYVCITDKNDIAIIYRACRELYNKSSDLTLMVSYQDENKFRHTLFSNKDEQVVHNQSLIRAQLWLTNVLLDYYTYFLFMIGRSNRYYWSYFNYIRPQFTHDKVI